jgi:hypothetical protein
MVDHTHDVPPHQHGGTDAPECTTCGNPASLDVRDRILRRLVESDWFALDALEYSGTYLVTIDSSVELARDEYDYLIGIWEDPDATRP